MIVSRKTRYGAWKNLEGDWSRLSSPYLSSNSYIINDSWYRLYGRSYYDDWDLNDKSFEEFKEV